MFARILLALLLLAAFFIPPTPLIAQGDDGEIVIPAVNTPIAEEETPVEPLPADEPDITPPGDDTPLPLDEGFQALLILAATVTAFMEQAKSIAIKPISIQRKWSEQTYISVVTGIALIVGVFAAIIAGESVNLLAMIGITSVHPLFGIVLAGILVAFGNEAIHQFYDLGKGLVHVARAWEEKQRRDSPPKAHVIAPIGSRPIQIGDLQPDPGAG